MAAYDPYLNKVSIENIVKNVLQDCGILLPTVTLYLQFYI